MEVFVGGSAVTGLPATTLSEHDVDVSLASLPTATWIRSLMARIRPDVVHAHWFPDAFRYLVYGATPMIATAWGSDIYRATWTGQVQNRFVARFAGMVMADSTDLVGKLITLGAKPERTVLFNWGVDLASFSPPEDDRSTVRRRLGLPEGRLILSPRSVRDVYNPRIIVDAFERLAGRHPDLHLAIKHMHRDAVSLAPLRFPDRVHVIGHVPYHQMADYYRAADICVSIPSSDSSPRSVWEALACGTPCIVSDLPWVHELLSDGRDVLVVAVDSETLASAMERLLGDPALASRMASNGRAVVERHRNREHELDRLIRVYDQLARERPGTSRSIQACQWLAARIGKLGSDVRHRACTVTLP